MGTIRTIVICSALLLCCVTPATAATVFYGPSGPYLQASDSPFDGLSFDYFHLEDHEDGIFTPFGASVNQGVIFGPNGFTDSVDGDDGILDGNGNAGRSYLAGSGDLTLIYTFDEVLLGSLPTHAGVVYTHSFVVNITLEAFDGAGSSVGQLDANGVVATTATALFFGVQHDAGISRIELSFSFSGTPSTIEVDHLQYGAASVVPIPPALPLLAFGLAAISFIPRRSK